MSPRDQHVDPPPEGQLSPRRGESRRRRAGLVAGLLAAGSLTAAATIGISTPSPRWSAPSPHSGAEVSGPRSHAGSNELSRANTDHGETIGHSGIATAPGSNLPGGEGVRAGVHLPDLPPAALRAEPELATPRGWAFEDAFPRTAGTGRLVAGAVLWTDFIYDDRGAIGVPVSRPVTPFAPTRGTYDYADDAAANNGADIFRVAIGIDRDATYWRVDWNTLVDRTLPMAVFTIDTDGDAATGTAAWPAGAHLTSPGIDTAIVVSARGTWLVDLLTDTWQPADEPSVDTAARSFIVRLPRSSWEPPGTSRVRLVSGIASASGRSLVPVSPEVGGRPGGPPVYNVAFRSHTQEPARVPGERGFSAYNYWNEAAQATALSEGDVTQFSMDVPWSELLAGTVTPEAQPTGWTTRWYVSSIEVGDGVVHDSGRSQDLRPNYLGRVQPYGLYVPTGYDASRPTPLTWLLHSAYQPHNAFAAVTPRFVDAACERRQSLCATPLGRGHDGWYFAEAELDFWEVWGRLREGFNLDPDRTVLAGFSMGGHAVYRLGLQHPHLFARAVVIGASPICGRRLAAGVDDPEAPGVCTTDGDTKPLLPNGRWLPFYIAHGTTDELLPIGGTLDQVAELDRLGLRHRFEHYLGQPHIPWYLQDRWEPAAEWIGPSMRMRQPAIFALRWYPHADRPDWGVNVTGAYWIGDVEARVVRPGMTAQVQAHSRALPSERVAAVRTTGASLREDAGAAQISELTWLATGADDRKPHMDLDLVNVSKLTVALTEAGFHGGPVHIRITTDGVCELGITDLFGPVSLDGRHTAVRRRSGVAVLTVPAGTHFIDIAGAGDHGREH